MNTKRLFQGVLTKSNTWMSVKYNVQISSQDRLYIETEQLKWRYLYSVLVKLKDKENCRNITKTQQKVILPHPPLDPSSVHTCYPEDGKCPNKTSMHIYYHSVSHIYQ